MDEADIEDGEVLEQEESVQTPSPPIAIIQNKQENKKPDVQRMKRPRPDESKIKKVKCKYWAGGTCHKGQDCTYLHEGAQLMKDELCKYFVTDTCIKGDECVYSHDTKKFPCKYFHGVGSCHLGDTCRFSHIRLTPEMIPKFIKDNEAFLQQVQQARGYTNLGEYYNQYAREKANLQPLLPLPGNILGIPQFPPPIAPIWIPPKPPSPDLSSRLHASGIIKSRNITIPKGDLSKLRKPPNSHVYKKSKFS
mmetsp:Transcript_26984/g.26614  ORF Transcript_26984/g.26614 Transcript_26984/m.26614 type:complete len:250 (-) Transcript_26984:4-753(-)